MVDKGIDTQAQTEKDEQWRERNEYLKTKNLQKRLERQERVDKKGSQRKKLNNFS